jgi:hypothetical protein
VVVSVQPVNTQHQLTTTMSFSDEFMPDDDSHSFDALLGLLTPPVSPEKVSKVQGQDRVEVDESYVQQLFRAVQIAQVQALDFSRAPAPAADTAAPVDEGSESDAEGEDDPDLLFPDFLGDDQPQKIQPIMLMVDLPVFSKPPSAALLDHALISCDNNRLAASRPVTATGS